MRLLHRFVVVELLPPLFYCLATFSFLAILVDLFNHLDDILKLHISWESVIVYYASYLPTIFVQSCPIAMLLATMYVLTNLVRSRQLTAMKAGGVSVVRALFPILFVALLLSLGTLIVNELVVPQAGRLAQQIREEKFRTPDEPETIPYIATLGKGNRLYYARSFDTKNALVKELIILEHDTRHNLVAKHTVEEAHYDGNRWIGKKHVLYHLDPQTGEVVGEPIVTPEDVLDIPEKPSDFLAKTQASAEFMNAKQLRAHIQDLSTLSQRHIRRLRVDWHNKFAFPLSTLILTLIGIPFALEVRKGGMITNLGAGLLVGMFYYLVVSVALALGKGGILPAPIAAWISPALFGFLGTTLLSKIPS